MAASNYRSSLSHLNFGVPQGSFLGTLLFLVYMIPLQHISSAFKEVSYTCYTDDFHLYIHFKPNEVLNLHVLHKCLGFGKGWMDKTFLQSGKAEILDCAPEEHTTSIMETLGPLASYAKSSTRNIGANFESVFPSDVHVHTLVNSCLY